MALLVGMVMALGLAAPAIAQPTVTPGAFCAAEEDGQFGRTVNDVVMICTTDEGDEQLRWREAPDGALDGFPDDEDLLPDPPTEEELQDIEAQLEAELDEETIEELEQIGEEIIEELDLEEVPAPTGVRSGTGGLLETGIPAGLLGVMALGLLLMGGGVAVSARKAE